MAKKTTRKSRTTKKPQRPRSFSAVAQKHVGNTKDAMTRTLEKKIAETKREVAQIMKKHAAIAAMEVGETLRAKVQETTEEMQENFWKEFTQAKKSFKL